MIKKNKSVLSEYIYQHHLENAKIAINSLAARVDNFKIGKTGMVVKDRFTEPDYDGEYDDIDTVFTSDDPDEVSRMEADLIEAFKGYANCDNIRTTDKDEMAESDEYSVYVVWK